MTSSTQASDQTRPQGNIPQLSIGAILLISTKRRHAHSTAVQAKQRLRITPADLLSKRLRRPDPPQDALVKGRIRLKRVFALVKVAYI